MRGGIEDHEIGPELQDRLDLGADRRDAAGAIGQYGKPWIARQVADTNQLTRSRKSQGELVEAEIDREDALRRLGPGWRISQQQHQRKKEDPHAATRQFAMVRSCGCQSTKTTAGSGDA